MVGRLLDGRYRIEDRIARGGMATVYTATDTRLDRVVALKIMHDGLGADEDFAGRFVYEARASARLNHPHVVAVFDQGEDDGTVYLVMEYVPGRTLRDVIRAEAPLSPRRALELLEQVLTALAAAHEAGLIHRDVKPENVLITPAGRIKVADFGLARAVTSSSAATATAGVLIGTVSYVAPEMVLHQGTDARTDVYACGILLYEMLTGRKPHEADAPIQVAYKHVHDDVPAPSALLPGLPSYVDALVARATARDRDLRPPDARVMLRQVRQVMSALSSGVGDEQLTADLALHRRPAPPPDDDWDAFLFESTATDLQRTAVTPVPAAHGSGSTRREPAVAARPRSRRGAALLAMVLLVAAAAGIGGWQLAVGQYTRTPQLVGLTLDEAEQQAGDEGLQVQVAGSEYSETAPEGQVLASSPEEGDRILDEGTVDLVVSLGKERYAVPELADLTLQEAQEALTEANLSYDEPTLEYTGKVAEGLVIRASPAPGTRVRPDAVVHLTVSRGRVPIVIPEVVGESEQQAIAALEEEQLVADVASDYSDEVAAGLVISQDPADGTAFKGDQVTIVVSLGPSQVEVPDVRGDGVKEARLELIDAGFTVKVLEGRPYLGLGYVTRQLPEGGSSVSPGSRITLFLI